MARDVKTYDNGDRVERARGEALGGLNGRLRRERIGMDERLSGDVLA